ncbi:MAG: sulfatase-like hydrolase/transferase [Alistipes sp.]
MRYSNYAARPSAAHRAGCSRGATPTASASPMRPIRAAPTASATRRETIAEVLKKRDYATAIFGKWHLGDASEFLPLQHGFDEWYGLPYSNDMYPYHPKVEIPRPADLRRQRDTGLQPRQTTFTTDYTERSVKFIRAGDRERPFFTLSGPSMPQCRWPSRTEFKGKSEQELYGDVMMELDWSVGEVLRTLESWG